MARALEDLDQIESSLYKVVSILKNKRESRVYILIGTTGSGKSTSIHRLLNSLDKAKEAGLISRFESGTKEILLYEKDDVILIDTPGFNDTHQNPTNYAILSTLRTLIRALIKHDCKVHLISVVCSSDYKARSKSLELSLSVLFEFCSGGALNLLLFDMTKDEFIEHIKSYRDYCERKGAKVEYLKYIEGMCISHNMMDMAESKIEMLFSKEVLSDDLKNFEAALFNEKCELHDVDNLISIKESKLRSLENKSGDNADMNVDDTIENLRNSILQAQLLLDNSNEHKDVIYFDYRISDILPHTQIRLLKDPNITSITPNFNQLIKVNISNHLDEWEISLDCGIIDYFRLKARYQPSAFRVYKGIPLPFTIQRKTDHSFKRQKSNLRRLHDSLISLENLRDSEIIKEEVINRYVRRETEEIRSLRQTKEELEQSISTLKVICGEPNDGDES